MSKIPNFDDFLPLFDECQLDIDPGEYGLFCGDAISRDKVFAVLKSDAAADYKKGVLRHVIEICRDEVKRAWKAFSIEKSDDEEEEALRYEQWAEAHFSLYMHIAKVMFPEMESEITKKYSLDKIYESPAKRGAPPKEGNVVDYILPQYADSAEQKFNELKEFAKARDFTKGKAAQARRAIIQKAMEHFDRVPTKILLLDLFGEENPSDSEIKAWDRYIRESDWPFLSDIELREKNRNRKQN